MSLKYELFKPDCANWVGYKPCIVQKQTGQPNCAGCPEYWPEAGLRGLEIQSYDIDDLLGASGVGIVEMGGLGSIMRTTAVSRAIRKNDDSTSIRWFTHRRGAELLEYTPGVIPVNVEDSPFEEYEKAVKNVDVMLNFDLGNAAKAIVGAARKVGGFALNTHDKFSGVMPHAEYMQRMQIDDSFRAKNRLTMQQILLKTIGLEYVAPEYDIQITNENLSRASLAIQDAFDGKIFEKYIGINIGTSEKGRLKRWPAESYDELAERLAKKFPNHGIMLLNGPDDDEPRTRVMAHLHQDNSNISLLRNNFEVGDFIGIVKRLDLVVTSDTFCFHAAKSQSIPTIVLTGPMPSQELEIEAGDSIFNSEECLSPCYYNCPQVEPEDCMKSISVEDVFDDACGKLMAAENGN